MANLTIINEDFRKYFIIFPLRLIGLSLIFFLTNGAALFCFFGKETLGLEARDYVVVVNPNVIERKSLF